MTLLTLRPHISRYLARNFHTTRPAYSKLDVDSLLSKPTWSLDTLLPSNTSSTSNTPTITSIQLHHLLRLSALPPPKDAASEQKMLDSLHSHLHFVTHIRSVDTTNISPLQSLRDETATGIKNQEIGLEDLEDAFSKEEVKGRYYKRIRRRQEDAKEGESAQNWDVLGSARKKVGRFFVVEGGKEG
jgi:Asp-tRNA(Asn)/Glu-tRNA(Gln) amidotransferase C subunit